MKDRIVFAVDQGGREAFVSVSAESSLEEVVRAFTEFLLAAGFHVDAVLALFPEE
jgi:hypothetical protein